LREQQVEVDEVEYSKAGLDEATVRAIVTAAGSVAAVLNTRHAVAKAKGWAATPPGAAEFARAVVSEPNLLRRPILIVGGKVASTVIVGFDRVAYGKLG
jgi:arsenate reductase-like glutaredoxin family protein